MLSFADAKNLPGYDEMYGKPLRILMTMVGLVLLIAMANVVMLLVARNASRQREFSVRQALGAGRGELFRQLATEAAILVAGGGALAWGFALAATRLLGRWAQIESSLAPDRTVLLFTLAVLTIAALLFALAPLRVALASGAATGLEGVGGHVVHRCRQVALRQDYRGLTDGALRGAPGRGRPADSDFAQPAEHSSRHAGGRPCGLRGQAKSAISYRGCGLLPGTDEEAAGTTGR